MRLIKVGAKSIGDGQPAFVIAEIGINHNGNLNLAKEMVAAAWESGADAVKIQTFITRDFLHKSHPSYQYDIDAEISHEAEQEIWDYARRKKILLFSTPEELKSLAFIKKQKPAMVKIASMDFNFRRLIQKAAGLNVPIILSSGMSHLEEVLRAARWVEETGNGNYAVLHCVSCYPTPPGECNLRAMQTLKSVLNCPVGFSDHSEGTHIALAAVTLGANIIEKHFTLDRNLPGPDQKSSMEPKELSALVRQIRDVERAFGDGVKRPSNLEREPRKFKRRGVYAAADLKKGRPITEHDIAFLAPSHQGSSIDNWSDMNGRYLIKNIAKGDIVSLDDCQ